MKKILILVTLIITMVTMSCNNSKGSATDSNESNKEETSDTAQIMKELGYDDSLPTLLDFSATWCGPCQQIAPLVHELEATYKNQINFIYVDVDDDPEMASNFDINAVPTFVLIDAQGNIVDRIEGADPQRLQDVLKSIVNN